MASSISRLVAQMDSLYEYDREPVAQHKLQSGWQFAGLFAGEHVAATEFVIGPFFVLHGVTARLVNLHTGYAVAKVHHHAQRVRVRDELTLADA